MTDEEKKLFENMISASNKLANSVLILTKEVGVLRTKYCKLEKRVSRLTKGEMK